MKETVAEMIQSEKNELHLNVVVPTD